MTFKSKDGKLEALYENSIRVSGSNHMGSHIEPWDTLESLSEWSAYWVGEGVIDESYRGMEEHD